jgi:hypothetical protein
MQIAQHRLSSVPCVSAGPQPPGPSNERASRHPTRVLPSILRDSQRVLSMTLSWTNLKSERPSTLARTKVVSIRNPPLEARRMGKGAATVKDQHRALADGGADRVRPVLCQPRPWVTGQ